MRKILKALINNYSTYITILFLILFGVFWLKLIRIRNWRFDDSFFGYTYAKNLVNGNGFTFNSEKILGTSAPFPVLLYALIFEIISWLKIKIEVFAIAEYISILSIILTSIFIFILLKKLLRSYIPSIIASLFLYFNIFYLMLFGHESILAILLIMISLYFSYLHKSKISFFLLALAFLSRAESVFLLPLIFSKVSNRNKKSTVFDLFVFFITPIVCWFAFSYFYFGQIFSNSMSFKILQTKITQSNFLNGLIFWFKNIYFIKLAGMVTSFFIFVALLFSFELSIFSLVNVLTIFFPFIFYLLIKISFYHWFLFLFALGTTFDIGYAIRWLLNYFKKKNGFNKIYGCGVILIASMTLLITNAQLVKNHSQTLPYPREQSYQNIATYLLNNTEENSSIAFIEIGQIAYFSNRKIVDVTGIATKNVMKEYKKRNNLYVYRHYKPDYILFDPAFNWLSNPFEDEYISNNYKQVKIFDNPRYRPLYLYKKIF